MTIIAGFGPTGAGRLAACPPKTRPDPQPSTARPCWPPSMTPPLTRVLDRLAKVAEGRGPKAHRLAI
jgi:hypothetical protein